MSAKTKAAPGKVGRFGTTFVCTECPGAVCEVFANAQGLGEPECPFRSKQSAPKWAVSYSKGPDSPLEEMYGGRLKAAPGVVGRKKGADE